MCVETNNTTLSVLRLLSRQTPGVYVLIDKKNYLVSLGSENPPFHKITQIKETLSSQLINI